MIAKNTRFGRWTIIGELIRKKEKSWYSYWYPCRCDCGNTKNVQKKYLLNGASRSCGCFNSMRAKERHIKHGYLQKGKELREYQIWLDILRRCNNENHAKYLHYGGRGIKVCSRWLIFENFLNDMGYAPKKHQIDRINNDGDYSPDNCRWVTMYVQCRNKRTNYLITFIGITMPLQNWADFLCINRSTLKSRLVNRWKLERAFGLQ